MKRKLLILLVMGLVLGLVACQAQYSDSGSFSFGEELPSDFSQMTETQLEPFFRFAKESVEHYYQALFHKSDDFRKLPTSDMVAKFLEARLATERERDSNYIEGTYHLRDWEIIDGLLWCKIAVQIEYQYSSFDPLFDLISAVNEPVQIIIENPQDPTIVDWHVGGKSGFDVAARGNFLDLRLEENWLSNQDPEYILSRLEVLAPGFSNETTILANCNDSF